MKKMRGSIPKKYLNIIEIRLNNRDFHELSVWQRRDRPKFAILGENPNRTLVLKSDKEILHVVAGPLITYTYDRRQKE